MKSLILALTAVATVGLAMPSVASADSHHYDRGGHDSHDRGHNRWHSGYHSGGHNWGHRSWVCRTHYGHRSCTYRYW